MARKWRVAGAIAILAVLAAGAALLTPAYWRNLRFEQYLENLVSEADIEKRPDDFVRVAVAGRAASLGIPLRPEDVRVDRGAGRLRIETRYVVRVDVPIYTVDLHFRANSGAR
ncbi:MAG: hypothetical protein KIT09_03835 [Bryobacteraceae bacterium]|nr:hypothetical protein [Bryobacteraceae bacterium]